MRLPGIRTAGATSARRGTAGHDFVFCHELSGLRRWTETGAFSHAKRRAKARSGLSVQNSRSGPASRRTVPARKSGGTFQRRQVWEKRRAAIRLHKQAYSCTGTACKLHLCKTMTFTPLTRKSQLWPNVGLVHELWPLRRPGQADQLHAPGALPYFRLLAGFDQALGNEARLVVAGEVRVGRAHDAALGVAHVYPIPGHPTHSG